MRESDGALRVVGFTPNPLTGKVERTSEGAWEAMPAAAQTIWVRSDNGQQAYSGPRPEVSPEDEQWL